MFPTIDEDILREMHWLAFNREHRDQKFALEWIADHLYGKSIPAPPDEAPDAPGSGGLSISIAPKPRDATSTSTSFPLNSEPPTPSSPSESGTSR